MIYIHSSAFLKVSRLERLVDRILVYIYIYTAGGLERKRRLRRTRVTVFSFLFPWFQLPPPSHHITNPTSNLLDGASTLFSCSPRPSRKRRTSRWRGSEEENWKTLFSTLTDFPSDLIDNRDTVYILQRAPI